EPPALCGRDDNNQRLQLLRNLRRGEWFGRGKFGEYRALVQIPETDTYNRRHRYQRNYHYASGEIEHAADNEQRTEIGSPSITDTGRLVAERNSEKDGCKTKHGKYKNQQRA